MDWYYSRALHLFTGDPKSKQLSRHFSNVLSTPSSNRQRTKPERHSQSQCEFHFQVCGLTLSSHFSYLLLQALISTLALSQWPKPKIWTGIQNRHVIREHLGYTYLEHICNPQNQYLEGHLRPLLISFKGTKEEHEKATQTTEIVCNAILSWLPKSYVIYISDMRPKLGCTSCFFFSPCFISLTIHLCIRRSPKTIFMKPSFMTYIQSNQTWSISNFCMY